MSLIVLGLKKYYGSILVSWKYVYWLGHKNIVTLTEIGSLLRVNLVVSEGLPLGTLGVLLLLDGVVQGHHLWVLPSARKTG